MLTISNPHHGLQLVADYALLLSLVATAVFIVMYAARSPWRSLLVGRSLMYLAVSMFLVLAQNSIAVWYGLDYPGRDWVRVILYVFLATMLWRLVYTLIKVQNARVDSVDNETLR